MRLFPLALLAVVLALPAAAQSQFSEDEGAFLTFDEFTVQRQGTTGWNGGGQVGVGWRFGNGTDVALNGSYTAGGLGDDRVAAASWSLGLASGYTLRPTPGTVARIQGLAAYERVGATFSETPQRGFAEYDASTLALDLSATMGYEVSLGGSFRLRPTAGVYGQADRLLSFNSSGLQGGFREAGDWRAEAGIQLEAPVSFRLFGTDAAVVPAFRRAVVGNGPVYNGSLGMTGTLGLRLNF